MTSLSDDFNRADSSSLGSTSVGSVAWTASVWGIDTNRAKITGAASAVQIARVETGAADGTYSVKLAAITLNTDFYGPVVRMNGSNNGYLVQVNAPSQNISVLRSTGGSNTLLGSSASYTPAANDVISVVLSGTSITVKVNGTTKVAVTDSTYQTGTQHGMWGFVAGATKFDDFSWTDAGGGSSAVTVAAPVLAVAVAAPAPTVSAGTSVSVAAPALALSIALLTPTVSVAHSVDVAAPVLAVSTAVPAPTVVAGTAVTVDAPALSLTLAAPAPTVDTSSAVTVAAPVLDLTTAIPAPVVLAGSGVAVSAPTLTLTLAMPAPTVTAATSGVGLIPLDVSVDLLVLSQESQSPVVEDDGVVLLDATVDIVVRHQLVPVAPPLGVLSEWPVKRFAHLMPALTAAEPRRKGVPNLVGSDPYLYRTEHGDVGRFHTFIDGVDVTYLRDSPLRFDNITSGVQVGPLSATINVPQMRPWDVPGEGDLAVFDMNSDPRLEVVLVREDDSVEHVWDGALARDEDSSGQGREDYTFNGEGAMMQASHEMHEPPIFQNPIDPGWLIAEVLNSITNRRYMKVRPFTTGLTPITDRGQQGQSKWQRAQDLLAKCIDDDGRQLALVRVGPWDYQMAWKQQVVTPQWTFTKGAPGVEVSLTVDQSTRRDAIYGRGVDPEGGVWGNYFFPGLDFYTAPRYPMNNTALNLDGLSDSDTDTGNGITTWQRRMVELGYPVTVDGVMNPADATYVRQIQSKRGITVDGSLGPQTWSATFDKGATELNFDVVRLPLAEVERTRLFNRNANGAKVSRNPAADQTLVRHSMPEVDFGSNIWKHDATTLAAKMLARDSVPAHVGTITLTSDPHEADSSRFDIKPGDNVQVIGHRGDVVVQVAEVSMDDVSVTLTVDSKARDVMALEAILDRDRDARRDPTGRTARPTDMSSLNKSEVVQFESESRAGNYPRTAINGGLWTVLPMFVSQIGVAKVEFTAKDPLAELYVALFEKPITANRVASFAPDPSASIEGWFENIDELKEKHGLLEIFGTPASPGGYWPWQKGEHALTGRLVDTSGAVYSSKYGGYVWVAVFTSRSTWVQGRVFPANGR